MGSPMRPEREDHPSNGCCASNEKETVAVFFDPLASQQVSLDIQKELIRARSKHCRGMNSAHEGYAVLLEEVREVEQEVFHGKDRSKLRAELIQVAAMAQRMIEDLRL